MASESFDTKMSKYPDQNALPTSPQSRSPPSYCNYLRVYLVCECKLWVWFQSKNWGLCQPSLSRLKARVIGISEDSLTTHVLFNACSYIEGDYVNRKPVGI